MRLAVIMVSMSFATACIGPGTPPPQSPLAKLSYDGSPDMLYVGEGKAVITPFNASYTELFEGQARELAKRSHRARLIGSLTNLVTIGAGIATLVLPFRYEDDWNDLGTAPGRATLGLAIGAALVGTVAGYFSKQARAGLQDAINLHNEEVLAREVHAAQGPRDEPPAPAIGGSPQGSAPQNTPVPAEAPTASPLLEPASEQLAPAQ